MEHIQSEPATAKAYRTLERMLVTLELAPGSEVTEGTLIDRVGLGRTPVREAIQRLAWEMLIEIRPRAGLVIAPLHPADWLRVLDARRGVEIALAKSAARFITPQAAEKFDRSAVQMQAAAADGDIPGFLEADKAFDEALADASDNPFAARLAAPLQTHSRRFWFRFQRDAGLVDAVEHHIALIKAILDRDVEGAGRKAERLIALLRLHADAVMRG